MPSAVSRKVTGTKNVLIMTTNSTSELSSQLNGIALGLVMGLLTGRGVIYDWDFADFIQSSHVSTHHPTWVRKLQKRHVLLQ